MNNTRRFKLKKDISSPMFNVPAGTIFYENEKGHIYKNINDGQTCYDPKYVDFMDEWFEEIPEPRWTDRDMKEFALYFCKMLNRVDIALENWKKEPSS